MSKEDALFQLCKKFVDKHKISCADAVHQSDRVQEDATNFIEDVCEIVGYWEWDEDNE